MNGENTKPEILIATTLRWSRVGTGVHTQMATFKTYLESVGHPVRVVSTFGYRPWLVNPILAMRKLIHPISGKAWLNWHRTWHSRFIAAALRQTLDGSQHPVIYAQDVLTADAALNVRTSPLQKVVLAWHSPGTEADEWVDFGVITPGSSMYEAISEREQRVLCGVDSVVFASAAQRSRVLAGHPGMCEISSVVMPQFVAVPESRGNQAPQHDAVTVGRIEPRKNHKFLVDVIAAARAQGHEYSLTIIGDGPEHGALQRQIERLGLQRQVTLAGRVEHDIGLELENHRIYLHASPQESFGLAAVEAMALGIPTITGDTGVVELLDKGVETVVWNDLADPEQGARQLIEIMSDPARLADLGRRGKARFDQSFTIPAVAPQLADYLTEAANRPR